MMNMSASGLEGGDDLRAIALIRMMKRWIAEEKFNADTMGESIWASMV